MNLNRKSMNTYLIEDRKKEYQGFLDLESASIRVLDADGEVIIKARRERAVRPDSAAVLVFNRDRDAFIFTHQFRYPISENEARFISEIPAGGIDQGEGPRAAARREVLEEIGYQCKTLSEIAVVYSSPGTTSERIYIYYAEVGNADQISQGGGRASENEEISIEYKDRADFLSYYLKIEDAKTLLAIQWFIQNKKAYH